MIIKCAVIFMPLVAILMAHVPPPQKEMKYISIKAQADLPSRSLVAMVTSPPSSSLQITPQVIGSMYCVGDSELDVIRLKVLLAYVNRGSENVILYTGLPLISRIMIARSPGDIEAKRFEVNSTVTQVTTGGGNCYKGEFPNRCFITLPPGGSYQAETTVGVFAVRGDARKIAGAVYSGNHVLQIEVLTWLESNELARELSSRRQKFGKLWYEPITSAPFAFTIERNRPVSDCP